MVEIGARVKLTLRYPMSGMLDVQYWDIGYLKTLFIVLMFIISLLIIY